MQSLCYFLGFLFLAGFVISMGAPYAALPAVFVAGIYFCELIERL